MKKIGYIILAVVVIIVLIIVKPGEDKPKNGKGMRMLEVPVKVVVTKNTQINEQLSVAATILADQEIEIKPEVAGKVISVNFKEGEHVNKGQLLLQLDDSDLQATIEKNNSSLKLSKDKEARLKALLAKGGVSTQEYESVVSETNSLKAEARRLQSLINKTSIHAPFDGTVGLSDIAPGTFVSAGQTITRIADVHPLKVEFALPERYTFAIKSGSEISFNVTGDEQVYTAKVYALDPVIDPATRTLKAKAIFENKNETVLPGSFAEVKINVEGRSQAISLPTPAIVPVLKGQKVYRIKNNIAEEVKVETGLRTDSIIEVTKGLTPGDTIAVTGVLQLRQGAKVKIIK